MSDGFDDGFGKVMASFLKQEYRRLDRAREQDKSDREAELQRTIRLRDAALFRAGLHWDRRAGFDRLSEWEEVEHQEERWWDEWIGEEQAAERAALQAEKERRWPKVMRVEEENRRWRETRKRRAREQAEYEKLIADRALSDSVCREIIQELSGFTGVGHKSIKATQDELWGGRSGPRGCRPASWDNAVRAWEDGE